MRVLAFTEPGRQLVGNVPTDLDGQYEMNYVPAGTVFVVAFVLPGSVSGLVSELYDDLPCPLGPDYGSCDVSAGTPVLVATGQATSGIDLALSRGASLAGSVSDEDTATPLPEILVKVWLEGHNSYLKASVTDGTGSYNVPGLPDGSYFVAVESGTHLGELYDDVPCHRGPRESCSLEDGTAIALQLGEVSTGIDFALEQLGQLSGKIVDAATGAPLPFIDVRLYDSPLGHYQGGAATDLAGRYVSGAEVPGEYYATASTRSSADYFGELFDDLPCPDGSCSPTEGTPIQVDLDHVTTGVDFALHRLGTISGRVVDADTGLPILGMSVLASDMGYSDARGETDITGRYSVGPLFPGPHFVRTIGLNPYFTTVEPYQDEIFREKDCDRCPLDSGDAVVVPLNGTVTDIDFTVRLWGSLTGTVTDAVSEVPLNYADIRITNAIGQEVNRVNTDYAGNYTFWGLRPDTYFVTARAEETHVGGVYDGLRCQNCYPTSGTPIVVSIATTVEQIDFSLQPLGIFHDDFETGDLSGWQ